MATLQKAFDRTKDDTSEWVPVRFLITDCAFNDLETTTFSLASSVRTVLELAYMRIVEAATKPKKGYKKTYEILSKITASLDDAVASAPRRVQEMLKPLKGFGKRGDELRKKLTEMKDSAQFQSQRLKDIGASFSYYTVRVPKYLVEWMDSVGWNRSAILQVAIDADQSTFMVGVGEYDTTDAGAVLYDRSCYHANRQWKSEAAPRLVDAESVDDKSWVSELSDEEFYALLDKATEGMDLMTGEFYP